MVKGMKKGSLLVDVSIDQGVVRKPRAPTRTPIRLQIARCGALLRRQHAGAVARTSTFALNNATLPFVIALAENGPEKRCR